MILLITANIALGNYEHFAVWESKPDIVICESDHITKNEVIKSLEYWQKLGYHFSSVEKTLKCPSNKFKKIIITEKKFENKQGNTNVKMYRYHDHEAKYLSEAMVELNQADQRYPGENRESLVHELGHALGIDHVENVDDIMFAYTRQ